MRYPVLDRRKHLDFAISSLDDFTLGDSEAFNSSRLLSDPRISLYALDFERNSACFVELSAAETLEKNPFIYLAQRNEATHLITIPLDEFEALATRIEVDDSRLVFIQSVGRCGSTLLSRVFGSMGSVRSLSEPDAFTNLVGWRGAASAPDNVISRMADSCVRTYCKPVPGSEAPSFVAMKFRSQCVEIDDLLADAFPAAKHVYLTREPISWLDSAYRAFINPKMVEDYDYRTGIEDTFAPLHPLLESKVVKGRPMPTWKFLLLNWIANREVFCSLQDKGVSYCVADYSEIKSNGLETISRILDYCEIPIADLSVIEECLSRDSQKGSGIDQTIINTPAKQLPEELRTKARMLLSQYGYPPGD
jgi:hypothetical protein